MVSASETPKLSATPVAKDAGTRVLIPKFTVGGFALGMTEAEIQSVVREKYDIITEPGNEYLLFNDDDGPLILHREDDSNRLTWVAGTTLEFGIQRILEPSTDLKTVRGRLGDYKSEKAEKRFLCDGCDEGYWYPKLNLLLCLRANGQVVASLGSKTGWTDCIKRGGTWEKLSKDCLKL